MGVPHRTTVSPPGPFPALKLISRILAAVVGGYLLSAGLITLAAMGLGFVMAQSEAVVLVSMLGFLLYLAVLLWSFAERRLWRVWAVTGGGGAATVGLTLWLAPVLAAARLGG